MENKVQIYYTKLTDTLEEMTKIYRQLLEVVRQEKEHLVNVNLGEIEKSTLVKEELIGKIRIADMLREKYAQNLGAEIGVKNTIPRLLEIAQYMPMAEGDRLRQMHAALDMVIRRIQTLNKENETYAQSALKNLDGALGNIKDTLSGKKTYERKGQYKTGPETSGHFVSKEA